MATNISLAFDANDTPYIAYSDGDNNYKATVMKFIKGGWKTVGEA